MTTTSNAYCVALGVHPPQTEDARSSPDANYYSLLLMTLLERGEPMTLEEHGYETPWAEVQLARLADRPGTE